MRCVRSRSWSTSNTTSTETPCASRCSCTLAAQRRQVSSSARRYCASWSKQRPVVRPASLAVLAQLLGHARQLAKRRVDQQLGAHALAQLRREAGGAHRAGEEGDRVEERAAPVVRQAGIAGVEQRAPAAPASRRRSRAARRRRWPRGKSRANSSPRSLVAGVSGSSAGAQAAAELAPQVDARREAEVGEQRGAVDLAPGSGAAAPRRAAGARRCARARRAGSAGAAPASACCACARRRLERRVAQPLDQADQPQVALGAAPAFGSAALSSAVRSQGEVPAFAIATGSRRRR